MFLECLSKATPIEEKEGLLLLSQYHGESCSLQLSKKYVHKPHNKPFRSFQTLFLCQTGGCPFKASFTRKRVKHKAVGPSFLVHFFKHAPNCPVRGLPPLLLTLVSFFGSLPVLQNNPSHGLETLAEIATAATPVALSLPVKKGGKKSEFSIDKEDGIVKEGDCDKEEGSRSDTIDGNVKEDDYVKEEDGKKKGEKDKKSGKGKKRNE